MNRVAFLKKRDSMKVSAETFANIFDEIYLDNCIIVTRKKGEAVGGKVIEITETETLEGDYEGKIVPIKFIIEDKKKMEIDISDVKAVYEQDNL